MMGTEEFDIINFLQEQALTGVAGLAMAGTVLLLWKAFVGEDVPEDRLKAVVERRADLRAQLKAEAAVKEEGLLSKDNLQQFAAKMKNLPWLYSSDLKKNMLRAGMRAKEAPAKFLLVKIGLPLFLFTLGFFLTVVLGAAAKQPLIKLLWLVGMPVFAFVMPDIWLKNTIQKREDTLRKGLPDAFDLLVICAEAGLGLDAALDRVSKEIAPGMPALAEEIGITGVELGFLPDRRMALLGLTERVQLPSIRALVNTLIQSEKYGTPLAQALRVLSAELRDERMMKAEEKAAKLPATLTVPMILFILPTLFIVLLGPAIIQVFDLNKG